MDLNIFSSYVFPKRFSAVFGCESKLPGLQKQGIVENACTSQICTELIILHDFVVLVDAFLAWGQVRMGFAAMETRMP